MKAVVAIDSFKGCLTSREANRAAAEGLRRACPEVDVAEVPVSDGGEGFVEAFHSAIGGELVAITVSDPLMRPVTARYLMKDGTAVIEMAQASGLTLLSPEERNPLMATSYGTGQLVADAVSRGARHVIVGLGGSATSDVGTGMLRALTDAFSTDGTWDSITALRGVTFTVASDVRAPLCGPDGAAYVFAPQKGATPAMVRLLDERARDFSAVSARHFGYDRSLVEGAGAAGGLGYAFMQYLGAECRPGIELLLEAADFRVKVSGASLVITGEGSADGQTLMGKLPMGILRQSGDTPVCLIAGRIGDRDALLRAGFARVECINPPGLKPEVAMRRNIAARNIKDTVNRILTSCHNP